MRVRGVDVRLVGALSISVKLHLVIANSVTATKTADGRMSGSGDWQTLSPRPNAR